MRNIDVTSYSDTAETRPFYPTNKDVERALVDIVAPFGARKTEEAISFVAELKKSGRYQQDVY